MSLVELLVVLVVLVVVATLVVPHLTDLRIGASPDGRGGKSPQQIATETTMLHIRDAILGTSSQPGMWSDLGQRDECFPQTVAELLVFAPDLPPLTAPHHRATLLTSLQSFDPNTHLGWRGPYLQPSGARYVENSTAQFTRDYGYGPYPANDPNYHANDPAVLDAWGNPIILQFATPDTTDPNCIKYARLVSAGPNGAIDLLESAVPNTDGAVILTKGNCVDDVVLFFNVSVTDTRP